MNIGPDITTGEAATLSSEQLRLARRALTFLAILSTGSLIGVAASLYLVNHYPLLLIALSPLGRHLVLVAPIVDPVAFVVVSVVRRLLFYNASYELGSALGPSGISWIETRAAAFARFVRWLEALFARASHLVLLTMVGPTTSALAGISGMRQLVYLGIAVVGLTARVLIVLGFSEILREPIERILAWIDEYWQPGTALMVVGVLILQWIRIRKARSERKARASGLS